MEITPKKRTLVRGKISHFGKKALYVRRKNYYNVKRTKRKVVAAWNAHSFATRAIE